MKTDIKTIAAYLSTAIWADGDYDEAEKEIVQGIAEAFSIKGEELEGAIQTAIKEIADFTDEQINNYLVENARKVLTGEGEALFEAAQELVMADGVLAREEAGNLLTMANVLGIEAEDALLMIVNKVKDEEDFEVEF